MQEGRKQFNCRHKTWRNWYHEGVMCSICYERMVIFRRVACPCGADIGEPCISKFGKTVYVVHVARRHLALQLQGQYRDHWTNP